MKALLQVRDSLQSGGYRALAIALPMIAFMAMATAPARAQESTYAEEYQNRIKSAGTIQANSATAFGEQIDLYTGATSFEQVDLVLEGNGPPIRIVRRSIKGDREMAEPLKFTGFGDWELVIPQIISLVPGSIKTNSTAGLWRSYSPSGVTDSRCTYLAEGPWSPPANYYGFHTGDVDPTLWWQGYQLDIPGGGTQTILARSAGAPGPSSGTYPGVTNQLWQIGCLTATTSGHAGEAFLALAPDGTKYFLTQMMFDTYWSHRYVEPVGPYWWSIMPRNLARMKATRVEDRFGNYITYHYTGDKLTSITGSDGRSVTISWWPDAPLIQSISTNGRTWNYAYASRSATGGTLSQVTLPDNSAWTFTGTAAQPIATPVTIYHCFSGVGSDGTPLQGSSTGITSTYAIKHPAGATSTFRYSWRLRAQSYMPSYCLTPEAGGTAAETLNPYFLVSSLVQRELAGPGIATGVWNYEYEVHHASMDRYCGTNGCQGTTYTDVTAPDGTRTRYVHSTRHAILQGKLLRTEIYEGGSALKRSEDRYYNFAEGDRPYPGSLGSSISANSPPYASENLVSDRKTVVSQQGKTFTWEVPSTCGSGSSPCFDAFARPTKVVKSSTP